MNELGEDYLSADDACRVLDISRKTLDRYAKAGLIAKAKHRGRTVISQRAILDYWARREHEGDRERAAAEKRSRRK